MSQFRIEKRQTAACLLLTTGALRSGHVFVVSSLTTHSGPERVGDLLNDEHGFFPFQHVDGTTGQYNREHVVMVKLPRGVNEEELEPGFDVALRRDVVLTLSTGAEVAGTVLVNAPPGRDRLSDYVRSTKRFWYVMTPEGTALVNSAHIVELVEKAA
jgi:hypothetical protein